jgi:hypothetical protein
MRIESRRSSVVGRWPEPDRTKNSSVVGQNRKSAMRITGMFAAPDRKTTLKG